MARGVKRPYISGRRSWGTETSGNGRGARGREGEGLQRGAVGAGRHESLEVVQAWLATPFEGGRHARRVDKLAQLDGVRKEQAVDAATR